MLCSSEYRSMQLAFEELITGFLEHQVGTSNQFLPLKLSNKLQKRLIELQNKSLLQSAGIGNLEKFAQDKATRSDLIYWMDKAHHDPLEEEFFQFMDAFVIFLNTTCYAGIKDYEFHYALYETGSFYKRHLDQFQNNSSRAFSMIMYLNDNWQYGDGGELCIYHSDEEQLITPLKGKCVFFKSDELEHEVLLSKNIRMSITGWLKV